MLSGGIYGDATSVNVESLASGVYFVKVLCENETFMRKIVK